VFYRAGGVTEEKSSPKKKPSLQSRVKKLFANGETLERMAQLTDVPLHKITAITSGLEVRKYELVFCDRTKIDDVVFLKSSKDFNKMVDWNRPIFSNGDVLMQRSGADWFGFKISFIIQQSGLNFGDIGTVFLQQCLPLLLRQGLSESSGDQVIRQLKSIAGFNHFQSTWSHIRQMWEFFQDQGDLYEYLDNPNRNLKEYVAELLSDDASDSSYSEFVNLALEYWVDNSPNTNFFQNGKHNVEAWVEAWLAVTQHPSPPPSAIPFAAINESREIKRTILEHCSPFDEKVIEFMLENNNFMSADVNLALNGKIKPSDLEFAKNGGFTTAKQVKAAKQLDCDTLDDLKSVQKYNWTSGEQLRQARETMGFEAHEHDLYVLMYETNAHVNWSGPLKANMLQWARSVDRQLLLRLKGFESPRSLVFFEEVLLTMEDTAVRTDLMVEKYNTLDAPGGGLTEDEFEDFLELQPYHKVVSVNSSGVSLINLEHQAAARKKHLGKR
jgi:hypothetical protein